MPSEVKYEEQKHCCTSCAMKRRCHVCDQPTTLACSDCAIDLRAVIYVCNKAQCRDEHEKKCAHSLQSHLDAKWISVEERLPEATQGQVEGPFIISDDVLCYWPADGGIHEVCNYDHEDHRWRLVHKAFEEPDCEPTHWQPLPAPPSGAKGETKP